MMQDDTWTALVQDIGKEVENRGGKAYKIYADDEWQNSGLKPGKLMAEDLDSTEGIDRNERFEDLE